MSTDRWNGCRLPKFVVEDVDRYGNIRVYFRKKGQRKVRLPGIPFTEEFMNAYRAALAGDLVARVIGTAGIGISA